MQQLHLTLKNSVIPSINSCATYVHLAEVLQDNKIMFIVQILLRANNIQHIYFQTGNLKQIPPSMSKSRSPSIFSDFTNHPQIASCNSQNMIHMSKNRLCAKNSLWAHLVKATLFTKLIILLQYQQQITLLLLRIHNPML